MAVIPYTFTHKQYTEQQNDDTQSETCITIRKHKYYNKDIYTIEFRIHNIIIRIQTLQN